MKWNLFSENPQNDDGETEDEALPLVAHLTELRDRLLRCVLAILIIFFSLFYFANDIYHFVSEPLRSLLPEGTKMIATEVASPFLTPFKLTLLRFTLRRLWVISRSFGDTEIASAFGG